MPELPRLGPERTVTLSCPPCCPGQPCCNDFLPLPTTIHITIDSPCGPVTITGTQVEPGAIWHFDHAQGSLAGPPYDLPYMLYQGDVKCFVGPSGMFGLTVHVPPNPDLGIVESGTKLHCVYAIDPETGGGLGQILFIDGTNQNEISYSCNPLHIELIAGADRPVVPDFYQLHITE